MKVIDSYAELASARGSDYLTGPVLRTRSVAARSIYAHLASEGAYDYDQVVTALEETGKPPEATLSGVTRRRWLLELARVMAAQSVHEDDRARALAICEAVYARAGAEAFDQRQQTIFGQLLFLQGDFARADTVVPTLERLPETIRHYLLCDLANPIVRGERGNNHEWLELMNGPFVKAGLEAVHLSADGVHAFDRLAASPHGSIGGGSLVSVIMSAFRPDDSLFAAVRSILDQTWTNLELIIVDDASGAEYDAQFAACAALDPRIKVLRQPVNGGTYLVRNAGLDHAHGQFVTFQDSDDWSHPRRLERQLAPLLADPSLLATRSLAVRAHDDLSHQWLGYSASRINASSLLFRKEPVLRKIGFFDSVRKSADLEYAFRMEAAFGKAIHDVTEPLAYTRLRMTSLSRLDFTLGWAAPARIAYQAAYRHWHHAIRAGAGPYVPRNVLTRPFPAPGSYSNRIEGGSQSRSRYDVVFVDDWQMHTGLKVGAIEELLALTARGRAVGIVHAETVAAMSDRRLHINAEVQQLVNDGVVDRLTLDDDVLASAVIVREPAALQYPPAVPATLRAEQVIITAHRPPADYPGVTLAFDEPTCGENARVLFGVQPRWSVAYPELTGLLPETQGSRTEPEVIGFPIDLQRWATPRRRRGPRPVIGRYDVDTELSWPDTAEELLAVYPDSASIDVRIMGSAHTARELIGRRLPPRWLVYRRSEVWLRDFLFQLDFFVYFPSARLTLPPVDMLVRAMATGTPVVLPERFAPLFGDAAVYCSPDRVTATVRRLHGKPASYDEQVARGQAFAARFSAAAYADRIDALLGR